MVLRSEQFNDVYFSAEDGLAETRHVFLNGNDLPKGWEDAEEFVICETGFGTGLNFLAVWKLFEQTALPGQSLHFISVEKYPLTEAQITEALEIWAADVNVPALADTYNALIKGAGGKIKMSENVSLELHVGDVNEMMPHLQTPVDCWFLDGFRPATNPEMWSETVFQNMARLSKKGASFATFTAAGAVRRGLESAGFEVRKVPGYGRKREMITGTYQGARS